MRPRLRHTHLIMSKWRPVDIKFLCSMKTFWSQSLDRRTLKTCCQSLDCGAPRLWPGENWSTLRFPFQNYAHLSLTGYVDHLNFMISLKLNELHIKSWRRNSLELSSNSRFTKHRAISNCDMFKNPVKVPLMGWCARTPGKISLFSRAAVLHRRHRIVKKTFDSWAGWAQKLKRGVDTKSHSFIATLRPDWSCLLWCPGCPHVCSGARSSGRSNKWNGPAMLGSREAIHSMILAVYSLFASKRWSSSPCSARSCM